MLRILLLTAVTSVLKVNRCTVAAVMEVQAADFEVFGRVQGVFFRKNTKRQADMLGIRGWVMNTPRDTVIGHLQGPVDQMRVMMEWLQKKGSPASVIDRTEFRNQKSIRDYTFTSFEIRQDQDPGAYD